MKHTAMTHGIMPSSVLLHARTTKILEYGLIWTWHAYEGSLLSIETRNSEHEDWQPI